MNIPALFIRRPVASTLLAIAIGLAGLLAYWRLPVAPLPNVAFPVIVVQANMAGASPQIMASTVAEPLERRLATIAGVTELTSTNYVGSSMVVVQFDLARDINGAARDVEAAIQAARADLPTTLRSNPTYREYNPADSPILILALTSSTLTPAQLYDSASTVIQQQLSQVNGVGQITLGGGALPSVRVELEPDKLSSYGIGLEDVRAAIAAANADSAKGHIDQGDQRFEVISNDQATKAADYRDLVIAYRSGAPVLLHDVAAVVDGNENIRNAGLFNNQPAVGVVIYPLPGANIIQTVAQIKKTLPGIVATLPHSIQVHLALDRSQSVTAALTDTQRSLGLAVVLVIGVVFVFLQSPRATLIPAVVLPLSILGTFAAMYLLDYSIDNLSLMALTIATGFVVDDAVVVLENVVRHLEAGLDPIEAAMRGSAEVSFTVISHEPVADRRIHPDPGDARNRRRAVPRIRGDAVGRDPVFAADFTHGHTDDVRVPAGSHQRGKEQGPLGDLGGGVFRAVQGCVFAFLGRRARSFSAGGHGAVRPDCAECRVCSGCAVDVFSGAGQWLPDRTDHRRSEHFLSGDGQEARAAAAHRADGSSG